jgi:hypothetical protein
VNVTDFADAYADALRGYLVRQSEAALRPAYELGREALAGELVVLELANVHNEALLAELSAVRGRTEVERVARAAGEFFLESLSAFEMLRRAYREAQEAALVEQRQTMLLRRLSTFLADASDSLDEMLQLVAEQTREAVGAECCAATADAGDGLTIEARCDDRENGTAWPAPVELAVAYARLRPERGVLRAGAAELAASGLQLRGWLAAPLTRLDGTELGLIHLLDKEQGEFSDLDAELLVQLAQLGAAAIERAELHARAGVSRRRSTA